MHETLLCWDGPKRHALDRIDELCVILVSTSVKGVSEALWWLVLR